MSPFIAGRVCIGGLKAQAFLIIFSLMEISMSPFIVGHLIELQGATPVFSDSHVGCETTKHKRRSLALCKDMNYHNDCSLFLAHVIVNRKC